jgi:cobalt-zinc-cadmium efflux system protein
VGGGHGHAQNHGHAHGHGHSHGHASARAGEQHKRSLVIAFGLTAGFFVVQIVTGFVTDSLALISDAGHMATDALGLGMALAAIQLASSTRTERFRTFGLYRLEILAALANAVLLFGVAIYVIVEAFNRFDDPPDIESLPVLLVGVLGLVVNVIAFLILREGAAESLNMRGAYLEVLSDMLGSVGVILAATVMWVTDWGWVDPAVGALIGVFILPRAATLGRDALRVLVQAAPAGVDPDVVRVQLSGIPGVLDVHDLHVWTLTSGMDVASAHLVVGVGTDTHAVLDRARDLLQVEHQIVHATLQIEPDDHRGCDEVSW